MSNAVIGALRVVFGADTAAFEKGITRAERKMKVYQRSATRLGGKLSDVGKKITAGITVPVTAAATAFGVAAHKIAMESRQIATSAQVAGESFENFQRQAHAAQSVGIEFEKLGDIFKDVRDRVGDFAATGGGPMADFFENIAPKVGVTAEAFKGLSGKDALQLYFDSLKKANVSQEEMVFYLEAMASDTTNLIPLLEKGGAAFDKLGEGANVITDEQRERLERYVKAQEKLQEATEKLTIAFVESGLLDTITDLVTRFAEWTSNMAETNPTLLKVGTIVAGVAAAFGPFLVALGKAIMWFGKSKVVIAVAGGALRALLGPIGLVLAAIQGLYYAWKNWDGIVAIVKRVYHGVKTWLQDNLGAVFKWVGDKVSAVTGFFEDMYIAVVGNSYVPDMVDEIGQHMSRLQAQMVDPAQRATQSVTEATRQMASDVNAILARLFPDIAKAQTMLSEMEMLDRAASRGLISERTRDTARLRLVQEGKGNAPLSDWLKEQGEPLMKGMSEVGDKIIDLGNKAETQTVRVAKSFADMAQDVIRSLRGLAGSIKSGDFLGILEGVLGIFTQLGSAGLFGSGIQANLNRTPSFDGGGYTGMGPRTGGMDGKGGFLAMLHPNETVVDHTKGQRVANDVNVTVGVDPRSGNILAFVDGRIAATLPLAANAGAQQAGAQMARSSRRRVR